MARSKRLATVLSVLLLTAGMAAAPPLQGAAFAADPLLSENFEDGLAQGWSASGGTWAVQPDGTNQVYKATYNAGGTTTLLSSVGDATWSNYSTTATLKNYTDGNSISLMGRYRDANNTYKLSIHTQNNTISLIKTVAGTSTTLDTETMTLDPNVAYQLALTLDGDKISGSLNGTSILSATDYSFTTGKIAVGGYSKGSFSIDDVNVTATDGPPAGSGNRYVTPTGAGTKDGTSWANAFPGDQVGGLQSAWNATGATNTLYIGSGLYDTPQTLTMFGAGTSVAALKTIAGMDTGSGLPVFRGDWSLTNQVSRSLIDVQIGVKFWRAQDIRIENYHYGIYARGEHEGVRISNVDMKNMSDAVYFWGLRSGSDGSNPAAGSHDIIVSGGDYLNYTKSAVRFRNGNYNAAVIDTRADGGGQANWIAGNFPLGFRVGNSPQASNIFDHDIVFQDVTSRNNYYDGGTGYWNGDGFTSERQSYNITYIRARAFDSTDGGFDDKARNPVYIDTVAMGNKRNYRIWSNEKATFIGAVGAYSTDRGGTGDSVGLWAGAGTAIVEAYFSTFYNNANSEIRLEDAVSVDVYDSIIAKTNGSTLYTVTGAGPLTVTRSAEYIAGVSGTNPNFVNANADWEGGTTAFNSQVYGTTKGYHLTGPYQTPFTMSASASSVSVAPYATKPISVTVKNANGTAVSDPESVIWYSENGTRARMLTSRGASAQVQGLTAGTTEIVALYKGEEIRIPVTVSGTAVVSTCAVEYTTTGAARGPVTGEVAVTNTGDAPINGWTLAWASEGVQDVVREWGADITQTGTAVSATNTSSIAPGETARFGFTARSTGPVEAPSEFLLNDGTCTRS